MTILIHLYNFQNPRWMTDQVVLFHLDFDRFFQIRIRGLLECLVREEISDQGYEERLVLVYEFGEVHVTEDPHHDGALIVFGVDALDGSQGTEY